ncbi:hypothetical protein BC829DRAFT_391622 [Chytridium lagenaria]|nr:hypothetical protein BC829DRAFT_391622 [Chytridium lagenaria]
MSHVTMALGLCACAFLANDLFFLYNGDADAVFRALRAQQPLLLLPLLYGLHELLLRLLAAPTTTTRSGAA